MHSFDLMRTSSYKERFEQVIVLSLLLNRRKGSLYINMMDGWS